MRFTEKHYCQSMVHLAELKAVTSLYSCDVHRHHWGRVYTDQRHPVLHLLKELKINHQSLRTMALPQLRHWQGTKTCKWGGKDEPQPEQRGDGRVMITWARPGRRRGDLKVKHQFFESGNNFAQFSLSDLKACGEGELLKLMVYEKEWSRVRLENSSTD